MTCGLKALMTKKICIIDYKINNISSIKKAIKETGHEYDVIDDGNLLYNYSHVILPGIGSFDTGVNQLKKLNFFNILKDNIENLHLFGICLGMQILFEKSNENESQLDGLGILKGSVKKIEEQKKFSVYCPHLGWNNIYSSKDKNLFNMSTEKDYYFANSHYIDPIDKNIIEYSFYHGAEYTAAIKKDNIYGVQFHPEKSKDGIKILKDFCNLS